MLPHLLSKALRPPPPPVGPSNIFVCCFVSVSKILTKLMSKSVFMM